MLLTGLFCGILLGFVMQRGRFCITGAFRDLYVTKNNKMFVALLIAITVQSVGFFLLKEIGVLNVDPAAPPTMPKADDAHKIYVL